MSARAMFWAMERASQVRTPTAMHLLFQLADQANHDGVSWPSRGYLAVQLNVTWRSIVRAGKELEQLGLLSREVRLRDNRQTSSNLYRLHLDHIEDDSAVMGRVTELSPSARGGVLSDLESKNGKNLLPVPGASLALVQDPIQEIFELWQEKRGRPEAKLTDGRRAKIKTRLKRFTPEQLKQAIVGVGNDPWQERSLHDDLTVIFRNDEQVEKFLRFAAHPPKPAQLTGQARLDAEHAATVARMDALRKEMYGEDAWQEGT